METIRTRWGLIQYEADQLGNMTFAASYPALPDRLIEALVTDRLCSEALERAGREARDPLELGSVPIRPLRKS
jgi:hypothetical protein